jgi:serine protease Do
MKQYLLKSGCSLAMLALLSTGAFAQDENKVENKVSSSSSSRSSDHSDDVIIIKPKTDVNTKLTIEINGADVKINGKPMSEFKSEDVSISKRGDGEIRVMNRPSSRFRGGSTVYSYSEPDNDLYVDGTNSNKAFLGVGTEKVEEGEGVEITSVTDESAAQKAGLKEGDVITKVNETKISSPAELTRTIGKFKPDEKITVTYKRDKKEMKATASLTKRKNQSFSFSTAPLNTYKNFNFDNNNNFSLAWGKPRLGLKAQETEDGKGLKVLDVDDESAAEKAGIKEGDIITTFDGTEVNNIDKLRELSKAAMEKISFKVKLNRDGKQQEVDVKVPRDLKTTNL